MRDQVTFCIKTIHRPWSCQRLVESLRRHFDNPEIIVVDDGQPELHGNGCENCHGPGSAHVAAENGDIDVDEAEAGDRLGGDRVLVEGRAGLGAVCLFVLVPFDRLDRFAGRELGSLAQLQRVVDLGSIDANHPISDLQVFHAGTAQKPGGDLVTAGGRVLCVVGLAFSPDGATVAFVRQHSPREQAIVLIPNAGGEEKELTSAKAFIAGLDWIDYGRALAFSRATT